MAIQDIKLKSYFTDYSGKIFRIVEGQHYISTRPLVDSDEEQDLLENILDASKPPAPTKNKNGNLNYLLYTPFRYPPLRSGGRFHTRIEQSIFYGSEELKTAMAEVAYGRFLFMEHTQAQLAPMQISYTHFAVNVASKQALKLTEQPFLLYRLEISHPSSYKDSQPLGSRMREAKVELFTFFSARDIDGINVGLFSVDSFQQNTPIAEDTDHWNVYVDKKSVEFKRSQIDKNEKETHAFKYESFCIDGNFPEAGASP